MRSLISQLLCTYAQGFEHPLKVRIIRALARQILGNSVLVKVDENRLLGVSPADLIGWAIMRTGSYEKHTLALIRRILGDRGGCFVDVGANIGLHTVAASGLPNTFCIAFEPHPTTFSMLQSNIALNGLSNVVLCNFALSSETRMLPLESPVPGNSGTVRVVSATAEKTSDEPSLQQVGLAFNFVADQMGVSKIELMKIDVEGYEIEVLEGIDFSRSYRPRNIILEFSDYGLRYGAGRGGRQAIVDLLTAKGYESLDVFGDPITASDTPCEANAWFKSALPH